MKFSQKNYYQYYMLASLGRNSSGPKRKVTKHQKIRCLFPYFITLPPSKISCNLAGIVMPLLVCHTTPSIYFFYFLPCFILIIYLSSLCHPSVILLSFLVSFLINLAYLRKLLSNPVLLFFVPVRTILYDVDKMVVLFILKAFREFYKTIDHSGNTFLFFRICGVF